MADAGLLGLPTPFDFEGKTYQVCPRTYAMEALFRTHHEAEVLRDIQRHRRELGEETYEKMLEGWRHDLAAKAYHFGGPLSHRFLFSPPGLAHMLFLKLKAGEQHGGAPVERETIDRVVADRGKADELLRIMMAQDYPHLPPPETEPQTTARG